MKRDLGGRIEEARRAAGMTQAELGKAIKRSQKTVAGYEAGNEPPLSVLEHIAKATGTTLIRLLNLQPDPMDILHRLAHENGMDGKPVRGLVVGLLVEADTPEE